MLGMRQVTIGLLRGLLGLLILAALLDLPLAAPSSPVSSRVQALLGKLPEQQCEHNHCGRGNAAVCCFCAGDWHHSV
jgi:hypothetical protein